jgi:phage-related protein
VDHTLPTVARHSCQRLASLRIGMVEAGLNSKQSMGLYFSQKPKYVVCALHISHIQIDCMSFQRKTGRVYVHCSCTVKMAGTRTTAMRNFNITKSGETCFGLHTSRIRPQK